MDRNVDLTVLARVVAKRAAEDPDRLAFIFENGHLPDEEVYYRDLELRGNQIAHELKAAGLRKGDRVAVVLRNHPEFLYALVANSKLGLVNVSVDPRARADKLDYFLRVAECAALIVADYVVADDAVAEVVRRAGVRTYVLATPEGRAQALDTSRWATLNEVIEGSHSVGVGQYVRSIREPWLLAFTSGTTGLPKGIVFSYDRMLLLNALPGFFDYRDEDILYNGLSLSHGNALFVTMWPTLIGAVQRSIFSRWFTRSRLWKICLHYGCTSWSSLGGVASGIYSQPPAPEDRGHNVRLVVSAGMPREIWAPFEARFGVRILEWYGTTEGSAFAYKPVDAGPIGSFGKAPEGLVDLRVVDEIDCPVAPGELGELIARPAGRDATLEYWKDPHNSAKKVKNGWLYTGDICWRDEDDWLYFAFRKEDGGIRKSGEFIAQGFIERVLAESRDVLDVHVYGTPAKSGAPGESDIVAAIVVRDKASFCPSDLLDECKRRLERSHVPDYVQVVDEIAKTSSGKVQTRVLAEKLASDESFVFTSAGVRGQPSGSR